MYFIICASFLFNFYIFSVPVINSSHHIFSFSFYIFACSVSFILLCFPSARVIYYLCRLYLSDFRLSRLFQWLNSSHHNFAFFFYIFASSLFLFEYFAITVYLPTFVSLVSFNDKIPDVIYLFFLLHFSCFSFPQERAICYLDLALSPQYFYLSHSFQWLNSPHHTTPRSLSPVPRSGPQG